MASSSLAAGSPVAVSDVAGSIISQKRARFGSSGLRRRRSGVAVVRASGPERRKMPMPPRPGGVAMAAMVSRGSSGTVGLRIKFGWDSLAAAALAKAGAGHGCRQRALKGGAVVAFGEDNERALEAFPHRGCLDFVVDAES